LICANEERHKRMRAHLYEVGSVARWIKRPFALVRAQS